MKHHQQANRVEIVKPAVDKLSYRCVKLENGLRITFVSDLEADKAAAAMDVSVAPSDMQTSQSIVLSLMRTIMLDLSCFLAVLSTLATETCRSTISTVLATLYTSVLTYKNSDAGTYRQPR